MSPVKWADKPSDKPTASSRIDFVTGKPATKRLNINLPVQVHEDFKTAAARRRTDMSRILVEFILDWLQKNKA